MRLGLLAQQASGGAIVFDTFMVVMDGANRRIKKHEISDLSYISKKTNQSSHRAKSVYCTDTHIYYATTEGTSYLIRLLKSTYTFVNSANIGSYPIIALTANDTNLFDITNISSQSRLIRRNFDLSGAAQIYTTGGSYGTTVYTSTVTGLCHYDGYLYTTFRHYTGGNYHQKVVRVTTGGSGETELITLQTATEFGGIDTDGTNLFLCKGDKLEKYDMNGTTTGITYGVACWSVKVAGAYAYLGCKDNTIRKLNIADLSLVQTYGSTGSGDTQFQDIYDISIGTQI